MIKYFEQNLDGYDYVVGDIHGCFSKLQKKLDEIGFRPEVDRLFSVGDLIDRGPESDQVCDWLAKPWFHAVKGNHEQIAIDYQRGLGSRGDYISNGGTWFVMLDEPAREYYVEEFLKLPLLIQVETSIKTIGILHAECPLDSWQELKLFADQFETQILWSRARIGSGDRTETSGISEIYCGHTPVREPIVLGSHHYIDTGAVFGKELTVERIN